MPVVVVDAGLGNVGSVLNMLRRLGIPAKASREPREILGAERLLLPGVGAFDEGMARLSGAGLIEPLNVAVQERRVPILGICLGMQLMTTGSAEGLASGLGWLDAKVDRVDACAPAGVPVRVPHMGWEFVKLHRPHSVLATLPEEPRFYFAHSYAVAAGDERNLVATAACDDVTFAAALARDNIFGVQFHPEKSHRFGMALLRAYAAWVPAAAVI